MWNVTDTEHENSRCPFVFAGKFNDWVSACGKSGKATITIFDDGTADYDNRWVKVLTHYRFLRHNYA